MESQTDQDQKGTPRKESTLSQRQGFLSCLRFVMKGSSRHGHGRGPMPQEPGKPSEVLGRPYYYCAPRDGSLGFHDLILGTHLLGTDAVLRMH